jgi:hypothetical protein
MLIVCLPRIKLSYIRLECEYRKPISLLCKHYYMRYCLYREDYIDSLIEHQRNTPIPQAIDQGQCKLLEEIFIVVVHLIFSF